MAEAQTLPEENKDFRDGHKAYKTHTLGVLNDQMKEAAQRAEGRLNYKTSVGRFRKLQKNLFEKTNESLSDRPASLEFLNNNPLTAALFAKAAQYYSSNPDQASRVVDTVGNSLGMDTREYGFTEESLVDILNKSSEGGVVGNEGGFGAIVDNLTSRMDPVYAGAVKGAVDGLTQKLRDNLPTIEAVDGGYEAFCAELANQAREKKVPIRELLTNPEHSQSLVIAYARNGISAPDQFRNSTMNAQAASVVFGNLYSLADTLVSNDSYKELKQQKTQGDRFVDSLKNDVIDLVAKRTIIPTVKDLLALETELQSGYAKYHRQRFNDFYGDTE